LVTVKFRNCYITHISKCRWLNNTLFTNGTLWWELFWDSPVLFCICSQLLVSSSHISWIFQCIWYSLLFPAQEWLWKGSWFLLPISLYSSHLAWTWLMTEEDFQYNSREMTAMIFFKWFNLFFPYSYVHTLLGPFHLPALLPSLPIILASSQKMFCPFLQFCWRDISNNKKDIAFLLVEIRIAIQRASYHCFHAHVYYNQNWFISTWPLHYFPVTFP
jgi:hypothetical protein